MEEEKKDYMELFPTLVPYPQILTTTDGKELKFAFIDTNNGTSVLYYKIVTDVSNFEPKYRFYVP